MYTTVYGEMQCSDAYLVSYCICFMVRALFLVFEQLAQILYKSTLMEVWVIFFNCIPNFAMSRYMGLFVENRVVQNSMASHQLPYISLLPFSNTSILYIYIYCRLQIPISHVTSCRIMSHHIIFYHIIIYVYIIHTISQIYIYII